MREGVGGKRERERERESLRLKIPEEHKVIPRTLAFDPLGGFPGAAWW